MNAHALQTLLLVLILLVSAVVAVRHLLPQAFRRAQSGIARSLGRPGRHRVLREWGRRMQPAEARRGGCGSGLGCASCAGCASTGAESAAAIPLKFSRPPIRPAG
ncbi:DUF6587 family protein [Dokdonella sp.]|uniref:DUF6587 family protein n=1 Tax=Dokdonella sp. TaxID=2291710 RepID=UPI0035284825